MSGNRKELRIKNWKLIAVMLITLASAAAVGLLLPQNPEAKKGRQALDFEDQLRARNVDEAKRAGLRSLSLANMNRLIESSEQATPRIMMAQYLLYFRYPPSSRPLSKQMHDLLDPFTVHPQRMPLYENNPPAAGEKPVYYYSWSAPSFMVTGRKPAVAYLSLYEPDSDRPVKITVISATMHSDSKFGAVKIADAQVSDDGSGHDKEADDGQYTFSWSPTPGRKLDWGEVILTARIKAPSGKVFELGMDFNSTPNPPARYTGIVHERLENGSLILSVEMDVQKAGKYILEGNLFDNADRPLHWVYVNRYLERGRQFVDMTFFGLIFHDKDFDGGRVSLRNLRGHRLHLPYDPRRLDEMLEKGQAIPVTSEPFQEWIEPVMTPFVSTKAYTLNDFSRQEYEGPDKAMRLQLVRDYTKDWEQAHGKPADDS